MDLTINNTEKKATFSFDYCGNLYFHNDSQTYDLSIDGENNMTLEKYVDMELDQDDYKNIMPIIGKLKPTNQPYSLKGKAHREYVKELNERGQDDSDDEDDMDKQFRNDLKMFPEEAEYSKYINLSNIEEDDERFVFYGEKIPLKFREDTNALYETIVYDNDESHGTAVMKSELVNGQPIYMIKVYTSGVVKFRSICGVETCYKLNMVDDAMALEKVDESNKLNITLSKS